MIEARHWLATGFILLSPCLASTPSPIPQGAQYEVGFSPNRGSLDLVQKTIGAAKEEILVAAYSFTSQPIAQALLDASHRGVSVRVVADKGSNGGKYSAVTFLANQGVPVRLNGHYAIHHHKFLVIDKTSIETGSFNFTASAAEKNAENVLVIWNAPSLASTYRTEWLRLWEEAIPLLRKY